MRLTDFEYKSIKETIYKFDAEAEIYLFGSRVDDVKRGGDIDLLILSKSLSESDKRFVKIELFERIGEQKIDLIIAKDLEKPFVRIAYKQGLRL